MGVKKPGPVGTKQKLTAAPGPGVIPASFISFDIFRGKESTFSTIGAFTMSCEGVFQPYSGVTLELRRGAYDLGIKKGTKEYPIPGGIYDGKHTRERFSNFMIELDEVAGFANIQIHVGNHPWETHGCILVGTAASLKSSITKTGVKALKAPVVQTPEERWNYSVASGLIQAPKGSKFGTTDQISGSSTALKQIAKRHALAEKAFGKGNVKYRIRVTDAEPAAPKWTIPVLGEFDLSKVFSVPTFY